MKLEMVAGFTRQEFEIMRQDANNKFNEVKPELVENLLWTNPSRAKWMLNPNSDVVQGYPILDATHRLSLRSFVAGFLEGSVSASRPWIRYAHPDPDRNRFFENRQWLDHVGNRAHTLLASSNFYLQAGQFFYDYGSVNHGAHIIKKYGNGFHFYTLLPGSFKVIQNALFEPEILIREFNLHAMALVKRYGKKKNGEWDWSNFSPAVKMLYEKSDTTTKIECVEIFCRNKNMNANSPISGSNREWCNATYETGVQYAGGFAQFINPPVAQEEVYLEVGYSRRKPFIVGKTHGDSPYGDTGCTSEAIGLIRSANKKAISKDLALEQMLEPTTQGPAHVRKSYITTQARKHIPLDATAIAQKGIQTVFEVNPAIGALAADVQDIRQQIERCYYADFLLYLSNNPKTRTAEEVREIVTEKQAVIGPNLQTLNWSYNIPIAEWVLDFIITEDPYTPPPPEGLEGEYINTQFTSVFAQVQKAFDLPQINQFVDRWLAIAQLNPEAWRHLNLQVLSDTFEDRYYLPAGLANPKSMVEALQRQAQAAQNRQQMIEALPAAAQASKNFAEAGQVQAQAQQGTNNVPTI